MKGSVMNKIEAARQLLKESNINLSEWSRLTGFSRTQIHRWVKGATTNIRPQNLEALAEAVGYKIEWDSSAKLTCRIVSTSGDAVRFRDDISNDMQFMAKETGLIPVVALADAGKEGIMSEVEVHEYVSRPAGMKGEAYAVTIGKESDSMDPIPPGTKVIASPNVEARTGDIAIIRFQSGDCFIKRVRFKDKDTLVMESWNPDYDDVIKMMSEIESIHPVYWMRLPR